MITWKRLDLIWKIGKCSQKTKLQYYNAVIKTKLTYALETMHLTKAQLKQLDTFQLKGLRKILKLKTTYIERENTNKEVRRQASHHLGSKRKRIEKVSTQVKASQHKLLMHILREPTTAPTRQATFTGRAQPNIATKKRVGRPRKHWTIQTMKRAWHTLRKDIPEHRRKPFRKRSKTIQHWLHDAASLHLL